MNSLAAERQEVAFVVHSSASPADSRPFHRAPESNVPRLLSIQVLDHSAQDSDRNSELDNSELDSSELDSSETDNSELDNSETESTAADKWAPNSSGTSCTAQEEPASTGLDRMTSHHQARRWNTERCLPEDSSSEPSVRTGASSTDSTDKDSSKRDSRSWDWQVLSLRRRIHRVH